MGDDRTFRVTVLASLTPRAAYALSGAPPLRAFRADDGAVDSLLAQIGVAVKLEVADPFQGGAKVRVELRLKELSSFRPSAIVDQVPALRGLLSVRGLVADLARRGAPPTEVQAELAGALGSPVWAEAVTAALSRGGARTSAAPAATTTAAKDSSIDALLAQVDLGTKGPADDVASPARPPSSALDSLISQVARAGKPVPSGSAAAAVDRLERAFHALLGDILDHPELRRLERTWRGLRLLLAEAKEGVDVEVVPVTATTFVEALSYLVSRSTESGETSDLLVADFEPSFEHGAPADLEAAALVASQLRSPLIVGASADLLNAADDDAALVGLRKAAAEPWAAWVTVAVNGGLVRSPITAETSRLKEIRYAQRDDAASALVFAPAPYLVAALSARSFRRLGWGSDILGPESGTYAGLDVHTIESSGSSYALATERLVSIESTKKHARRGLLAFTSVPNRDQAICLGAPTLAAGAENARGAPSLCDQIFASRLAAAVADLAAAIPEDTDPRAAEEVAGITLAELFPKQGARVPTVSVRVEGSVMEVTVQPRRFAGTTIGELSLDASLTG